MYKKIPNSIAKAFGHLQPYEDVGQPAVFDREYYFYLMLIHLSIKIFRSQTDTQYVIFPLPPLILIPYEFSTAKLSKKYPFLCCVAFKCGPTFLLSCVHRGFRFPFKSQLKERN